MPIDASEAAKDAQRRNYFFGALDENRGELSQGRDQIQTPRQAGEPLNFFVQPYAEQGGRKVENLASRVLIVSSQRSVCGSRALPLSHRLRQEPLAPLGRYSATRTSSIQYSKSDARETTTAEIDAPIWRA